METEKKNETTTIVIIMHGMNRCHAKMPTDLLEQMKKDRKLLDVSVTSTNHFRRYLTDTLATFRMLWRTCGVIV